MGNLTSIGEITGGGFRTRESYEKQKARVLASINNQTEYRRGDMIYCKYCNGEKAFDYKEKNAFVRCVCGCMAKKYEAEKERRERREISYRYRAENESLVPADVRGATFYNWNNGAAEITEEYIDGIQRCEKFCKNFKKVETKGYGIWLYGLSGSGKTYIAAAMLNELQNNGVVCIFTTMQRIFEDIKDTYSHVTNTTESSVLAKYSTVECLIIDNFQGVTAGGWKLDRFGIEKLTEIIVRRCEQNRPTVITAQIGLPDMFSDERIPSDILNKIKDKFVPIKITGNKKQRETQSALF